MIKKIILIGTLAALGSWLVSSSVAHDNAAAGKTTEEVSSAAKKFLSLLDETHTLAKVVYNFKDEEQRKRWSNLPTTFVKRGGLRMGDLTKPQRDAVLAVLMAALSPEGYQKAMQIVEGDEMLKKGDPGGGPGRPNGPRGESMFGHDEYYISFVGEPSPTEPWMIQFGGHHLAINITLAGEHATIAPTHTGSQPATYEFEGKTVRPLGHEIDKAFALLSSLNEAQRKQAILGSEMHDLVLGPGRDGKTIQPEGIKGSDLTDKQQEMLLDLASEWVDIMPEAVAKDKMADLKEHVMETWFTWSGPIEKPGFAYFRIQGPTVIIEYAPQTLGGDPSNHIHTIYREPGNDYGTKWSSR